jgi:hypothetical protein
MASITTSRTYLLIEMIALYVLLPASIYIASPQPLLAWLWGIALICGMVLFKGRSFKRSTLWSFHPAISF